MCEQTLLVIVIRFSEGFGGNLEAGLKEVELIIWNVKMISIWPVRKFEMNFLLPGSRATGRRPIPGRSPEERFISKWPGRSKSPSSPWISPLMLEGRHENEMAEFYTYRYIYKDLGWRRRKRRKRIRRERGRDLWKDDECSVWWHRNETSALFGLISPSGLFSFSIWKD